VENDHRDSPLFGPPGGTPEREGFFNHFIWWLPSHVHWVPILIRIPIVFVIVFIFGLFREGTVVGVLPIGIVYKAISVPHRKYRGEQREGRLKAAKNAAYPQYKEHALGKKCIHEVGKMIYRRGLTVV
jgi:hypothetical protein